MARSKSEIAAQIAKLEALAKALVSGENPPSDFQPSGYQDPASVPGQEIQSLTQAPMIGPFPQSRVDQIPLAEKPNWFQRMLMGTGTNEHAEIRNVNAKLGMTPLRAPVNNELYGYLDDQGKFLAKDDATNDVGQIAAEMVGGTAGSIGGAATPVPGGTFLGGMAGAGAGNRVSQNVGEAYSGAADQPLGEAAVDTTLAAGTDLVGNVASRAIVNVVGKPAVKYLGNRTWAPEWLKRAGGQIAADDVAGAVGKDAFDMSSPGNLEGANVADVIAERQALANEGLPLRPSDLLQDPKLRKLESQAIEKQGQAGQRADAVNAVGKRDAFKEMFEGVADDVADGEIPKGKSSLTELYGKNKSELVDQLHKEGPKKFEEAYADKTPMGIDNLVAEVQQLRQDYPGAEKQLKSMFEGKLYEKSLLQSESSRTMTPADFHRQILSVLSKANFDLADAERLGGSNHGQAIMKRLHDAAVKDLDLASAKGSPGLQNASKWYHQQHESIRGLDEELETQVGRFSDKAPQALIELLTTLEKRDPKVAAGIRGQKFHDYIKGAVGDTLDPDKLLELGAKNSEEFDAIFTGAPKAKAAWNTLLKGAKVLRGVSDEEAQKIAEVVALAAGAALRGVTGLNFTHVIRQLSGQVALPQGTSEFLTRAIMDPTERDLLMESIKVITSGKKTKTQKASKALVWLLTNMGREEAVKADLGTDINEFFDLGPAGGRPLD